MKMQYQKYHKIQFCTQLYIDIWEIILHLQANPYRLKTYDINSLIFISPIIEQLMLVIFLIYRFNFFKKEKGLLYIEVLLHRVIF